MAVHEIKESIVAASSIINTPIGDSSGGEQISL